MIHNRIMKKENMTSNEEKRTANGLNMMSKEILSPLRRIIGKKGMIVIDLLVFWEQIVGQELAAYSFPEKISFTSGRQNHGVLYVVVGNGAFALELQHREKILLEKVNAYLGSQIVSSLKIRQNNMLAKQKKYKINQPNVKKILVSKKEQNYIKQLTDGLNNNNLRETLTRLGENVFSENAD